MKGSGLHKNNHSWEIFQEVEQRLKKNNKNKKDPDKTNSREQTAEQAP